MADEDFDLVIGLGITGKSCVRYLAAQGMPLRALDTRARPPGIEEFREQYPDVALHTGGWREDWLEQARRLVVSPGVAVSTPEIARQMAAGKEVIGDVELFARAVRAPVVAITGSNAKSTVTTLLGEALHAAGVRALTGGNLGTPALDLLEADARLYVMELSSFQLETTWSLDASVATVLNVSQDHLDRYQSVADYIAAKQRIYDDCQTAVWNRDQEATRPQHPVSREITFGMHEQSDYRLDVATGNLYARGEFLLHSAELALPGHHNALNVLAVLALAEALELPRATVLEVACRFSGLPHRCQRVAERDGVQWFNDSKGTNLGATLAALSGIGDVIEGKVVLIAGGQAKDQDFGALAQAARGQVRAAVLIGEDAERIAAVLEVVPVFIEEDMAAAVRRADDVAEPGDAVLLSPACASFDMYSGYVARGEDFIRQVREVHDAR